MNHHQLPLGTRRLNSHQPCLLCIRGVSHCHVRLRLSYFLDIRTTVPFANLSFSIKIYTHNYIHTQYTHTHIYIYIYKLFFKSPVDILSTDIRKDGAGRTQSRSWKPWVDTHWSTSIFMAFHGPNDVQIQPSLTAVRKKIQFLRNLGFKWSTWSTKIRLRLSMLIMNAPMNMAIFDGGSHVFFVIFGHPHGLYYL